MKRIQFELVTHQGKPAWAVAQPVRGIKYEMRACLPITADNFTLAELHDLHTQAVFQRENESLLICITLMIDTIRAAEALSTPSTF